MKAKNSKEVAKGYVMFSFSMAATVLLAVIMSYSILHTTKVEVRKMLDKSVVFDQTYAGQMDLVEKVDSLHYYTTLINSAARLNNVALQNIVSTKKMQLLSAISNFDRKDVLLYGSLLDKVSVFLQVKDSVRIVSIDEQQKRFDLQRCVEDNKNATRKLTLGNIVIEK